MDICLIRSPISVPMEMCNPQACWCVCVCLMIEPVKTTPTQLHFSPNRSYPDFPQVTPVRATRIYRLYVITYCPYVHGSKDNKRSFNCTELIHLYLGPVAINIYKYIKLMARLVHLYNHQSYFCTCTCGDAAHITII